MQPTQPIMDAPPPYDSTFAGPGGDPAKKLAQDTSLVPREVVVDGPSTSRAPPVTVYHYVHPMTQERITSLLPPSHPEMICLQQGEHVPATHYGLLGVLAAIFWFPLGIGLCLLDRRVTCQRCGAVVEGGISC